MNLPRSQAPRFSYGVVDIYYTPSNPQEQTPHNAPPRDSPAVNRDRPQAALAVTQYRRLLARDHTSAIRHLSHDVYYDEGRIHCTLPVMALIFRLEDGLDGQAKQPRDLERCRIVAIVAVVARGMLSSKGNIARIFARTLGARSDAAVSGGAGACISEY